MKIALVDDDIHQLQTCKDLLIGTLTEMGVTAEAVDCFSSAASFADTFAPNAYDIIILDMYMEKMTGIDVARKIRERDRAVTLAFCTSGNEFAAQSYEVEAKYYVNKPITKEKVIAMLNRFNLTKVEENRSIRLPDDSRCLVRQILYTEYTNHSVAFYIQDQDPRTFYMTHREAENLLLAHKGFCVINKGCIVNFAQVKRLEALVFLMQNGQRLPIARRRFKEIEEAYTGYRFEQMEADN